MLGIYMMYDYEDCFVDDNCTEIANFIIYKAFHIGFYSQITCSVQLKNISFYDNAMSFMALVLGPAADEHQFANKFIHIEDALFVGQSPSFDCDRDKTSDADKRNVLAGIDAASWFKEYINSREPRKYGKIAIGWPFFLSENNLAPQLGHPFPFAKMMPAMYGRITVEGN